MKLAAIVVNYCTAELTARAIDELLVALSDIADSKVIVVDNASPDGSAELLAERQKSSWKDRVDVIKAPHNGGYGYGINQGVLHAKGFASPPEYLYALNSDAFVSAETMQTLLLFMAEHPEAGVVGGSVLSPDGSFQAAGFRFPSPLGELELNAQFGPISKLLKKWAIPIGEPKEASEVDWVPGSSMLIRQKVFDDVGLFDERFFLYFEETDFCKRVWDGGWKIFMIADAAISHVGAASTGLYKPMQRTPSYWFESRHRYLLKHHGFAYTLTADCAWIAGQAVHRVKQLALRRGAPRAPRIVIDFIANGARDLAHPLQLFQDPEHQSAPRRQADRRRVDQLCWIELLAEDISVYRGSPGQPGLWAVLAQRVASRLHEPGAARNHRLLKSAAQGLLSAVDLVSGIQLSSGVKVGRRVWLGPGGCVQLDARSVGDDVQIQQGTCFGPLRAGDKDEASRPVLENGVSVSSGSTILGAVTVGENAVVRPNSVVLSDVAPNVTVLGVPAKVV